MSLKPGREFTVAIELESAPGTYGYLCKMQDRGQNIAPDQIDTTGLDCTNPGTTAVVQTAEPDVVDRSVTVTVLIDNAHESMRLLRKYATAGQTANFEIVEKDVLITRGNYMVQLNHTAPVRGYQSYTCTLIPTTTPTDTWQGAFA